MLLPMVSSRTLAYSGTMDSEEDSVSTVSPGLLANVLDVPKFNREFELTPDEWVCGLGPCRVGTRMPDEWVCALGLGGLGTSTTAMTSDISLNHQAKEPDPTLVLKKKKLSQCLSCSHGKKTVPLKDIETESSLHLLWRRASTMRQLKT